LYNERNAKVSAELSKSSTWSGDISAGSDGSKDKMRIWFLLHAVLGRFQQDYAQETLSYGAPAAKSGYAILFNAHAMCHRQLSF
jgi:hypothetical protein